MSADIFFGRAMTQAVAGEVMEAAGAAMVVAVVMAAGAVMVAVVMAAGAVMVAVVCEPHHVYNSNFL